MKKALLFLVLLLAATAGVLYTFPSTLLATAQFVESRRAGLSERSLSVDNLDIRYYEGGPDKAQTVLLIHGFGADKSNWPRFARFLTDRYHVIAVDLPGFGDSSRPANISYDVGTQAERLADFMRELGIGRFHVVGNSMGGHIAALLAARHPNEVLSAGLFDNAGVMAPRQSELFLRLLKGEDNPLVPRSVEDFPALLDFVFVQRPPMPSRLEHYLAERSLERQAFNDMVFQQLRERYIPLEPELPKITAPTLLLWGDRDRVLDVSSIDVMKPLLKRPSVAILRDCGHVPMIERPEETARLYLDFLQQSQAPATAAN
ncbi:putative lipase [Pseudomonas sp. ATCC 13867]|uniref:alpha/beta fold hydrolase n=1 Tax=Pseudomonas sp. ATCC 13867 TaxID=1294143 RepID=UPI0002C4E47E|nr:alpha/beta hydrolase [Pseudomonas sp. ATCC 13867]AGI25058.1 putative lipase [Pseudomonas sp. ATCC 13867]RFQ32520.1 alpha/beta hydrolase [Pseudomonas sp. ATCC 13867]